MLFSSLIFIFVFLPVTLALYYIISDIRVRNYLLCAMSLIFYAWGEPTFVLIMLASIVINWVFGLLVDKSKNKYTILPKVVVAISVAVNLSIIFYFKYFAFFIENINYIFHANKTIPDIELPIGISFFTFQALSYVIDVYRGHGKAQKNLLNVGLYISFFPQLIAGPIVRYETIADQIDNRKETLNLFSEGTLIFIRGLCKKIILANSMAVVADVAFGTEINELSVVFAWIGALAYTFQIFFDFSGYSDMAIGLGKMFGFEFLPNFNFPYISGSISEFWRRWHISLGTWFRDYVYFPLGGSRVKSKGRVIFNLGVIWILTGIWHGANWTFICWGIMYFFLLALEKVFSFEQSFLYSTNNIIWVTFRHIYTMLFVILGWVLFRSEDLKQAFSYTKSMFGIQNGGGFCDYLGNFYASEYSFYFIVCIICSIPLIPWIKERTPGLQKFKYIFYLIGFLLAIAAIVKGSYNPFIYFNF